MRRNYPLRLEPLEVRETPAAAGTLDPTFGTGGAVVLTNSFFGGDSAVDSLGRVVVVGRTGSLIGTGDFAVLRLNPDGTPDPTFGSNGVVTVDFGTDDHPSGVAVDANNNIVVVGNGLAFVRLTAANGAPDPTFGVGGTGKFVFTTPPPGYTGLTSGRLAIDAAGRIVAGATATGSGPSAQNDLAVVRLTPNGSGLDPTFNGGAIDVFPNPGSEAGTAVAIDAAGRIVLAGQSQPVVPGPPQAAVARLLPDGTPDPAFNGGHMLVSNLFGGSGDIANAVTTDAAGNVYLTGAATFSQLPGLPVARLTAAGTLDPTFGSNGVAYLGVPGTGTGIAVDPAGRVVVSGSTVLPTVTGPLNFLVGRLLPNGAPDPLFNPAGSPPGTNVIDLGASDLPNSLVLAPDGKIVVAGGATPDPTTTTPPDTRTEVVRLTDRVTGTLGRPTNLSVGGAANALVNVYTPSAAGAYANPPARQITATVFPGFAGDVRTATADVNGDGVEDTVLVTGPGVPTRMAVVSGKDGSTLLAPSDPFGDANFTFGGFVTAGDIDHDGRAEWVVTPELRGGPRVVIFGLNPDGSLRLVANFFGIQDASFRDGARAALGDVNSDGVLDVFAIAAFNGGPRTALFDGKDVLAATAQNRAPNKLTNDFFAAPSGQDEGRGGRTIAVGDVNGDGVADLIASGDNLLGTGNQVVVFSGADLLAGRFPGFGANPIANFAVSGQPGTALVSLATVNADGDSRADLAVGSGAGQASLVKVYLGKDIAGTTEPAAATLDPFNGTTTNGVFVG